MIMRSIAAVSILTVASVADALPRQPSSVAGRAVEEVVMNSTYREQLLQLGEADQQIRAEILKKYTPQQLQSDPGAARALALQIHASQQKNQQRLSELMAQYGFPDDRTVGMDGAHAGFLVAQHVPDRTFRESFLKGMEAAVQQGAYSKEDWALFVDRNRILTGQPQLYGTQHKADGSLFEIEHPEQLQERRAAVGLPPQASISQ